MLEMRQTRKAIAQFGFREKKSLGQHFLVDENVLAQIVELAGVGKGDIVLEIGPGPGSLTKYLVNKAQKVLALELDEKLASVLRHEVRAENLEVIVSDILKININDLKEYGQKLKVVSNLPYNISTEVIFRLLETPGLFSELYLMLQKEVAERLVARPVGKDRGLLSVICQYHSDPEIVMRLGPEVFKPRPKVDSALVKFRILENPKLEAADYHTFKKVVRAAFAMRRKMVRNSLAKSGLGLEPEKVEELLASADILSTSRAEELELENLVKLSNLYFKAMENA